VGLFSLFILTEKNVLVVQGCKVPTPSFPGMVIPVCRITNGGCERKSRIVSRSLSGAALLTSLASDQSESRVSAVTARRGSVFVRSFAGGVQQQTRTRYQRRPSGRLFVRKLTIHTRSIHSCGSISLRLLL
jgi:hypothetical protein